MKKSYTQICLDNNRLDDLIGLPRLVNLFNDIGVNIFDLIDTGYIEQPYVIDSFGDSCNRFTSLYAKYYIYAVYMELKNITEFNYNRKTGLDNGYERINVSTFFSCVNKRIDSMTERQKVDMIELLDLKVEYLNKLYSSDEMFDYCTHIIGKERIAKELGVAISRLNKMIDLGLIELIYHEQSKFYCLSRKTIEIYKELLLENPCKH